MIFYINENFISPTNHLKVLLGQLKKGSKLKHQHGRDVVRKMYNMSRIRENYGNF